jgi:hypothetical protein
VESGNIGTDNVNNLGFWVIPELLELGIVFLKISKSGNIVRKSVKPDIDDVAFGFFDRDAPIEGGSGDAKIVEARFDEVVDHLRFAALWGNESWVFVIELKKLVDVFAASEEIGRLLFLHYWTATFWADVLRTDLSFSPIGLFVDAIPTFVGAKIGIIVFDERGKNLLNGFIVAWLGGTNEVVVRNAHGFPKAGEFDCNLIDEFLRGNAFGFGVFLDLFAVLV